MENLIGIVFLATFVEGLITYLFGKQTEEMPPRPWLKFVSMALGIALSIAYSIDLLVMVGLESVFPMVGFVVSGVIIGRGANYLNDIFSLIKGVSKPPTY